MTPIQRRVMLLAPLGFAAIGGVSFWTLLERLREGRPVQIGIRPRIRSRGGVRRLSLFAVLT